MAKLLKRQKLFMNLFTVVAATVFVYALGFMTQYRELFGFKLKQNKGVADFYEITLQGFNKYIFIVSLIGMLMIFIAYCLEINSKVPDKFALIIMSVMLIGYAAALVFAVIQLVTMTGEYQSVDFSFVAFEGLENAKVKLETFYIGYAIFGVAIINCILYVFSMVTCQKRFLKENVKGDVIA